LDPGVRFDFKGEDGDQHDSVASVIENLVDIVCTKNRSRRKSGHFEERSLCCRDG
jgi:hypothetical protein